ncbi:uncharacterized protein LOC144085463 isoform X2 [Stigmatopora argus]
MSSTQNAANKAATKDRASNKKNKSASGGSGFVTCFIVLALLGVWTSIAVVYLAPFDYKQIMGKLAAYDIDGDGDFDIDDAKIFFASVSEQLKMSGVASPDDNVIPPTPLVPTPQPSLKEPEVLTEDTFEPQEQEDGNEWTDKEDEEEEEDTTDRDEVFEEDPEEPLEDQVDDQVDEDREAPAMSEESVDEEEEPATEEEREDAPVLSEEEKEEEPYLPVEEDDPVVLEEEEESAVDHLSQQLAAILSEMNRDADPSFLRASEGEEEVVDEVVDEEEEPTLAQVEEEEEIIPELEEEEEPALAQEEQQEEEEEIIPEVEEEEYEEQQTTTGGEEEQSQTET